MAVLMTPPYVRFFDNSSPAVPLSGGKVYTYQAGTTTPLASYTDYTGDTANANPVILDSDGVASIWLDGSYKIVVEDSAGNVIKTIDNITSFATSAAGGLTTEAALASATTTDLGSASSQIIDITGTTTITSFGSSAVTSSPLYFLRFTGILTLTYDATALILPGGANITTAAGDTCVAQYLGSGNWKVLSYSPVSGNPVVGGLPSQSGKAGDTLTTNGTSASWKAPNSYNNPVSSNPTGTSSSSYVMMGLDGTLTPASSGDVLIIITGDYTNSSNTTNIQLRYGNGTAPSNGDSATGTVAGNAHNAASASGHNPFTCSSIITGLTVGTAYWFDLAIETGGSGTSNLYNLTVSIYELK